MKPIILTNGASRLHPFSKSFSKQHGGLIIKGTLTRSTAPHEYVGGIAINKTACQNNAQIYSWVALSSISFLKVMLAISPKLVGSTTDLQGQEI